MIGLASLEVYNSVFDRTKENSKIEFCTDLSDELSFSFVYLGDGVADTLTISTFTNKDLQGSWELLFIESFKNN